MGQLNVGAEVDDHGALYADRATILADVLQGRKLVVHERRRCPRRIKPEFNWQSFRADHGEQEIERHGAACNSRLQLPNAAFVGRAPLPPARFSSPGHSTGLLLSRVDA